MECRLGVDKPLDVCYNDYTEEMMKERDMNIEIGTKSCGSFYRMTMHLLPVYYTTTSTKRRKKKNKTKSLIAAEKEHAKFLKSMGIGSRSSVGSEQRPSKPWVAGSSPAGIANSRSVGKSGNPPHLGCGDRRFESSRSDQVFYDPSMAKKKEKIYTG